MTLDKCNFCGVCKSVCPVYRVTLRERLSPRAKAVLAKKDIKSELFLVCTGCGACSKKCPYGVKISEEIEKRKGNI